MAFRMWASSTANTFKLSCAVKTQHIDAAYSLSRCFSTVLEGLKYAPSHEWVKHEGSVRTVGITDHAQVSFWPLPEVGTSVTKGGVFGAVESVKATIDVNSPISGEVVEVNTKLTKTPGVINSSSYEDGWIIKVKPSNPAELDALMGSKEYTKFCEEEDAAH